MHWHDAEHDGAFHVGLLAVLATRTGALRHVDGVDSNKPAAPAPPADPPKEEAKEEPPADPPKDTAAATQAVDGKDQLGETAPPAPEPEPEPAPEPEATPEPTPEPVAEPEPDAALNVTNNKVEPTPEPEAEPAPENADVDKVEAKVEPQVEPAADPKVEPEKKPATEQPAADQTTEPAKVQTLTQPKADPANTDASNPNATATTATNDKRVGGTIGAAPANDKLAKADATVLGNYEQAQGANNDLLLGIRNDATETDEAATDKAAADKLVADGKAEDAKLDDKAAVDQDKTKDKDKDKDKPLNFTGNEPVSENKPNEPATTPPPRVENAEATTLDQLSPEDRARIQAEQKAHEDALAEVQPDKPAEDAAQEKRDAYEQARKDAEAATAKQNEAYYNQQQHNVYIDPDGTTYQVKYENGQVIKTRQNEPTPVGQGTGQRDTVIVQPDAGGEKYTTEVTPPANPDGTVPPPIKSTIETSASGDVDRAWVEGAEDDAAKLDAALPPARKQQLADDQAAHTRRADDIRAGFANPPTEAQTNKLKDELKGRYDSTNVYVDPATGKVSGAGLNHETGELTLNRKNDRIETAPGVFASRDTNTKIDVAGTRALTGTTTKLGADGRKTGDPIRDEITTKRDGTIDKSMVTVLGQDGQPRKDDKGNLVPPNAEQLDTTVAPETKAAIAESQRQHTERVDALRGTLPNPSTEQQRREYTDRIEQNKQAIDDELKRYYGTSNLYVMPDTGEVYNATFDAATGDLRLQRPGIRTDFQNGSTENHQFYIERNGARREVRGIQIDGKDGKPGPAPIEFSTERTFSGELKGAHLTQADAQGVQQKLDDGATLDQLVPTDLREELVATQKRDDIAVAELRKTAAGNGPDATFAKNRINQLMDERGVHVDYNGTAYSSKWNRDSGQLDISRKDRPQPEAGDPPLELTRSANLRADGTRRTETQRATFPGGPPDETVQYYREAVETDIDLAVTGSQVFEGETRKNSDGSHRIDETVTNFDRQKVATDMVRNQGTRGGDGPKDSNGFVTTKDRTVTTYDLNPDGTPKQARARTDFGRPNGDSDPERHEDTVTDFWPGGTVPKVSTRTATTTRKVDDKTATDTTKSTTDFAANGAKNSTYVERSIGEGGDQSLLPRELVVFNPDGTTKTRVAGGATTDRTQLQAKADSPDAADLLKKDQFHELGDSSVRTVDPKADAPEHRPPATHTRENSNEWGTKTETPTSKALKPPNGSVDEPSIPEALRTRGSGAAIDQQGPRPGTPEYDATLQQQTTYQQQLDAAGDDAARQRIQQQYFATNQYWIDAGTDGAQPVVYAASYDQGSSNPTGYRANDARQPHVVLARTDVQVTNEDGSMSTVSAYQRVYANGTTDATTTERGQVEGSPAYVQTGRRTDGYGNLLETEETLRREGLPALEGSTGGPRTTTEVSRREYVAGSPINPETGEPQLTASSSQIATTDSEKTSVQVSNDAYVNGVRTKTTTSETAQSLDYDQGVVDAFNKAQQDAIDDARDGGFNRDVHSSITVPAVGSYRETKNNEITYGPDGKTAIYTDGTNETIKVDAGVDTDPDTGVQTSDPDGVVVSTTNGTTRAGSPTGTDPVLNAEGVPIVPQTSVQTYKTSEFDPTDGSAGGDEGGEHQFRLQTEITSRGTVYPDGRIENQWTPMKNQALNEGFDDDITFREDLYRTKSKPDGTFEIETHDGGPAKLNDDEEYMAADGSTQRYGGYIEENDLDFADHFQEVMDSKVFHYASAIGGIALAVGGVVAAPFSFGATLGLTAVGVGLASASFANTYLNYKQGEASATDLAIAGATVGVSVLPGAKGLTSLGAAATRSSSTALAGSGRLTQLAASTRSATNTALTTADNALGRVNSVSWQLGMNAGLSAPSTNRLVQKIGSDEDWTLLDTLDAANIAVGVGTIPAGVKFNNHVTNVRGRNAVENGNSQAPHDIDTTIDPTTGLPTEAAPSTVTRPSTDPVDTAPVVPQDGTGPAVVPQDGTGPTVVPQDGTTPVVSPDGTGPVAPQRPPTSVEPAPVRPLSPADANPAPVNPRTDAPVSEVAGARGGGERPSAPRTDAEAAAPALSFKERQQQTWEANRRSARGQKLVARAAKRPIPTDVLYRPVTLRGGERGYAIIDRTTGDTVILNQRGKIQQVTHTDPATLRDNDDSTASNEVANELLARAEQDPSFLAQDPSTQPRVAGARSDSADPAPVADAQPPAAPKPDTTPEPRLLDADAASTAFVPALDPSTMPTPRISANGDVETATPVTVEALRGGSEVDAFAVLERPINSKNPKDPGAENGIRYFRGKSGEIEAYSLYDQSGTPQILVQKTAEGWKQITRQPSGRPFPPAARTNASPHAIPENRTRAALDRASDAEVEAAVRSLDRDGTHNRPSPIESDRFSPAHLRSSVEDAIANTQGFGPRTPALAARIRLQGLLHMNRVHGANSRAARNGSNDGHYRALRNGVEVSRSPFGDKVVAQGLRSAEHYRFADGSSKSRFNDAHSDPKVLNDLVNDAVANGSWHRNPDGSYTVLHRKSTEVGTTVDGQPTKWIQLRLDKNLDLVTGYPANPRQSLYSLGTDVVASHLPRLDADASTSTPHDATPNAVQPRDAGEATPPREAVPTPNAHAAARPEAAPARAVTPAAPHETAVHRRPNFQEKPAGLLIERNGRNLVTDIVGRQRANPNENLTPELVKLISDNPESVVGRSVRVRRSLDGVEQGRAVHRSSEDWTVSAVVPGKPPRFNVQRTDSRGVISERTVTAKDLVELNRARLEGSEHYVGALPVRINGKTYESPEAAYRATGDDRIKMVEANHRAFADWWYGKTGKPLLGAKDITFDFDNGTTNNASFNESNVLAVGKATDGYFGAQRSPGVHAHELGHGIVFEAVGSGTYNFREYRAAHEAVADFLAAQFQRDPKVGRGFKIDGEVRNIAGDPNLITHASEFPSTGDQPRLKNGKPVEEHTGSGVLSNALWRITGHSKIGYDDSFSLVHDTINDPGLKSVGLDFRTFANSLRQNAVKRWGANDPRTVHVFETLDSAGLVPRTGTTTRTGAPAQVSRITSKGAIEENLVVLASDPDRGLLLQRTLDDGTTQQVLARHADVFWNPRQVDHTLFPGESVDGHGHSHAIPTTPTRATTARTQDGSLQEPAHLAGETTMPASVARTTALPQDRVSAPAGGFRLIQDGNAGIDHAIGFLDRARTSVRGNLFVLGGTVRDALGRTINRLGPNVRLNVDNERYAMGELPEVGSREAGGAQIGVYRQGPADDPVANALARDPRSRTGTHHRQVDEAIRQARALPSERRTAQQQELVERANNLEQKIAKARATPEADRTAKQREVLQEAAQYLATGRGLPVTTSRTKIHTKVLTRDGEEALISTGALGDWTRNRNELTFAIDDPAIVRDLDTWLDATGRQDPEAVTAAIDRLTQHDIYVNDPLTGAANRRLTPRVHELINDVQPGETMRVAMKELTNGSVAKAINAARKRGVDVKIIPNVGERLQQHANVIVTPRGVYVGTAYGARKTFDGNVHGRQSQEIGVVTRDSAQIDAVNGWVDRVNDQRTLQDSLITARDGFVNQQRPVPPALQTAVDRALANPVRALSDAQYGRRVAGALAQRLAADPGYLRRAGFSEQYASSLQQSVRSAQRDLPAALAHGSKFRDVLTYADAANGLLRLAAHNPHVQNEVTTALRALSRDPQALRSQLREIAATRQSAAALNDRLSQDASLAARLQLTSVDRFWIDNIARDQSSAFAFQSWFAETIAPKVQQASDFGQLAQGQPRNGSPW